MNFDSHSTEVLFSGRAEDNLYLLVWNKFDEKHSDSWLRSESMDGFFIRYSITENNCRDFRQLFVLILDSCNKLLLLNSNEARIEGAKTTAKYNT